MVFLSKKSCFRKGKQWRVLSYGVWPRVRYIGTPNVSEEAPAFIFINLFWRWNQKIPQKRWYLTTELHGFMSKRVWSIVNRRESFTSHCIYKYILNYERMTFRCLWKLWALLALQCGFLVKGKASHIPRSFHDDSAWWGAVSLFEGGGGSDIWAQLWNCGSLQVSTSCWY
jgi:hypothetical protein